MSQSERRRLRRAVRREDFTFTRGYVLSSLGAFPDLRLPASYLSSEPNQQEMVAYHEFRSHVDGRCGRCRIGRAVMCHLGRLLQRKAFLSFTESMASDPEVYAIVASLKAS